MRKLLAIAAVAFTAAQAVAGETPPLPAPVAAGEYKIAFVAASAPAAKRKPATSASRKAEPVGKWYTQDNSGEAVADRDRTKRMAVVIYTDPKTCVVCRKLESELGSELVKNQLNPFVRVKIDLSTPNGREYARLAGEGRTLPSIVAYHADGSFAMRGVYREGQGIGFDRLPDPKKLAPPGPTVRVQSRDIHDCPTCGTHQTFIDPGSMRRNGTHSHTCPGCGTTWFH